MNRESLRIVFMGTPDFAVEPLRALIAGGYTVAAVVTQPDKRKGRGKKVSAPPVKTVAEEAAIPVLQPTTIKNDEFFGKLRSFHADLIVVAAYGRILPASILTLPSLGCINIHGSLLPRHRGAAPIQWAIIEGDRETGITIMQMDEGMDTGDILLTAATPIGEHETAGELFARLSSLGAETLREALVQLEKGQLKATRQDHNKATAAPPLKKEMGLIDWNLPAAKLQCLIRGLDPWPSAYTFLDGKRFRLFSPQVIHKECDALPGTILLAEANGLVVATGRYALRIGEVQPEGKKRLSVEAFLCGHSLDHYSQFMDI